MILGNEENITTLSTLLYRLRQSNDIILLDRVITYAEEKVFITCLKMIPRLY